MARRRVLYNKSNKDSYLEVIPVEVQWVTIEMPIEYSIHSNMNWIIE